MYENELKIPFGRNIELRLLAYGMRGKNMLESRVFVNTEKQGWIATKKGISLTMERWSIALPKMIAFFKDNGLIIHSDSDNTEKKDNIT